MKLLRNVAIGAPAGAIGAAAMDLVVYARYRRDGGKEHLWRWEFAGDVIEVTPRRSVRLVSRLLAEHFAGTPLAAYFASSGD